MTHPQTASEPEPPPPDPAREGGRSEFMGLILPAGVLVLLWSYVVYRVSPLWQSNDDYAFGWFVPLLCLCLFWERWKRRPSRSVNRAAGGTFLLLGTFGLVLLPAAFFLEIVSFWRFAGWIFAGAAMGITFIILYFTGGRSWSRHFFFPVVFFLIAVPWPSRFEQPVISNMSKLNAAASTTAANILGTPAVRRGVLIETVSGLVGVDNACSGIRSLQSSIMVALFLGELFCYGLLRRGALVGGAVLLAFVCNVVRTTYLVRIADLHGIAAVKLNHDRAGFTILVIMLLGLLVLVWWLRPRRGHDAVDLSLVKSQLEDLEELHNFPQAPSEEKAGATTTQGDIADRSLAEPISEISVAAEPASPFWIKVALVGLVVWIVLVEMGIFFWLRSPEKQAATPALWSVKFPAEAPEYHESSISEGIRTMLRFDEGQQAEWRDKSGCAWQAFYFQWRPAKDRKDRYRAAVINMQARSHVPDICLTGAGMVLQTNFGTQTMTINDVRLRVSTECFLDQGRNFHVFTCYWQPNIDERVSLTAPGMTFVVRGVLDAMRNYNLGGSETRVIKAGVWGKESDEAAQAEFRSYLQAMISK